MGGQPMFILDEDTERTRGEDAQSSNITAGKAVSEAVRTTLGPRGMDKMLVSDSGDVVITNDGATILDEMDIEHPSAQMLSEVAETQEDEVGDGTTTAAVLAGELLSQAEDLLEDDVHPTTIVEGYHEAADLAHEAVDEITLDADVSEEQLRQVAESSMTGKGTGDIAAEDLAESVVGAIEHVRDGRVERENITIHAQTGASSSATELIQGVIVDEEPISEEMPRSVEDGAIAVIDADLEVREASVDAEYSVSSVDDLNAALDAEEGELREYAAGIDAAGASVAFITGDVDDRVGAYLADSDVLAFDDIDSDDAKAIASATGSTRVGSVETLEDSDLGQAGALDVQTYGDDDDLVFVEGGAAAESVTLFARGGTDHVVDELERALNDALDVVSAAIDRGGVLAGAGAAEIAISDHIREAAASVEGRKQLAVDAYADAVDVLPRTLASNTGMDPIDALVDLRAEYEAEGTAGIISEGQTGIIGDPVDYGVLDPAAVKHEAVESATEAATMIVRIDDVIAAN
jgi:thermosome